MFVQKKILKSKKDHEIITKNGTIVTHNWCTVKSDNCIIKGSFTRLYGKGHVIKGAAFTKVFGSVKKDNGQKTKYLDSKTTTIIGNRIINNGIKKKTGKRRVGTFVNEGNVIQNMTVSGGGTGFTIDDDGMSFGGKNGDKYQFNNIGNATFINNIGNFGRELRNVTIINKLIYIDTTDNKKATIQLVNKSIHLKIGDKNKTIGISTVKRKKFTWCGLNIDSCHKKYITITGKGNQSAKFSRDLTKTGTNSIGCTIKSTYKGGSQVMKGFTGKSFTKQSQNFVGAIIGGNCQFGNNSLMVNGKTIEIGSSDEENEPEPKKKEENLNGDLNEHEALLKATELSIQSKFKSEDKKAPLDANDDDVCIVCEERYISSVTGCGHIRMCYTCAIKIWNTTKKCPLCSSIMEQAPLKLKCNIRKLK